MLIGANLSGANLSEADLSEADLSKANLSSANLSQANLVRADLPGANLKNAVLFMTNLSDACVAGVKYKNYLIPPILSNNMSAYQGIRVDSCYGSEMFKSHAMDQDYIESFRSTSRWNKFLYWLWFMSSDCGRSMLLWAIWSTVLLIGFAWQFNQLGPSQFNYPGKEPNKASVSTTVPASAEAPDTTIVPWETHVPIYFSFVTFSTLGFGDVHPVTFKARMWVMAEVMIGYIMLGGLISILANKLARRA